MQPATSPDRAHTTPKGLDVVTIAPPPPEARAQRMADPAKPGEKRTRYSLPTGLESGSPVGYRTRVPLDPREAAQAMEILSLARPTGFGPPAEVKERELFEEASLGVLSSRQSTNFRGHRQVTLGGADVQRVAALLRRIGRDEAPVLDGASYVHVVLSRPYRTPFTFLLTFIGHRPLQSLLTVPLRALRKRFLHEDDIPTIGYLAHLHVGVLADAMERAAVIASSGKRRAQVFLAPFDEPRDRDALRQLEALVGLSAKDRREGVRIALVAQVGTAKDGERIEMPKELYRKLGAGLLAMRSERIQPGVNAEESAPPQYHARQPMDVPDALTVMAGRAAYNAFAHFTGCDRERAKDLLLLERVDVLTPNGKTRLRQIRTELGEITDKLARDLPRWADLPTGGALRRGVSMGRKAFALAGQRIYIGGLSRKEIERAGLPWLAAVRAFGAAAARSALVAELAGTIDLPPDCDLLAGVCLMAGPVNQNDIGKTFYDSPDLLEGAFPGRKPTSLLVWTLKAKTVADPIGNEEQLMSKERKGALVDLRLAPHEAVFVRKGDRLEPLRSRAGRTSRERAFAEVGNFVTATDGTDIPGNRGVSWPEDWADEPVFG